MKNHPNINYRHLEKQAFRNELLLSWKKKTQTSVHGYQIKYNFQRLGFLFIYFFSKLSTKITKRKKNSILLLN